MEDLGRLVLLNLKDSKNLGKLPRRMSMLKSLEELHLSGFSKLYELPEDLRKMESLKVLYVDRIATNQSLSTTNLLSPNCLHSALWTWLSPRKSPGSISFWLPFVPHSLVRLNLANCNLSDDDFSYGLTSLPSVRLLDLSGNPVHSLSTKGLTTLGILQLFNCTRLQSLAELPLSLIALQVRNCTSLERISYTPLFPTIHYSELLNCEKLVEYEGLFKLEPIKNTDVAVIKSLGLSNLESLGSIEVDLYSSTLRKERFPPRSALTSFYLFIYFKSTSQYFFVYLMIPMAQVLHECDISSIFLPRSEVPSRFILKNTGSLISFRVPPLVGHKIRGLNLCTVYAFDPESDVVYHRSNPHYAEINNKTKHMRWVYEPSFFARRGVEEEDMSWLSHWNFRYDEIEGEDEMEVSVVFPQPLQVKMCGICFVYEPEDNGTQSNTEETVLRNFPCTTLSLSLRQERTQILSAVTVFKAFFATVTISYGAMNRTVNLLN